MYKIIFFRSIERIEIGRMTDAAFDLANLPMVTGLPQSGKKFWKMEKFPGQVKVRELHFQSGKFLKKKGEKSWKSQGISKFS